MKRGFIFSINKAFGTFLLGVFMVLAAVQASAQISVTATAGVGTGTYTTLAAAFNAINAGTHGGVVVLTVTGSTVETISARLNANTLPAIYTSVTVKPSAGVTATITGNIAGDGTINLFGASNVTIDGSNTTGGTTQDLTIKNTSTSALGATAIRISSASTTVGATSNTIKNCNIQGGGAAVGDGIIACSGTTFFARAEAPNSNNTIQNNAISNCQIGLGILGGEPLMVATPTAVLDANWVVTGNTFSPSFNGIICFSAANTSITNNTFSNITVNGWGPVNAIEASWTINGLTISENKIDNISNSNSSLTGMPPGSQPPSTQGIYLDVANAGANVNVYNNFISNVYGFGFTTFFDNGFGIYIDEGTGYNIYDNTIKLTTNQLSAAGTSACICFDPAGAAVVPLAGVNLEDNIFVNSQTTGGRYAIYSNAAASIFTTIDYNDYYSSGGFLGRIGGIDCGTLVQVQANFGSNLFSTTFNPLFISATDLHLQLVPANNPLVIGIPITTPPITTDIDGSLRSTTITTLGAHEFLSTITYTPLSNTCSAGNDTLNGVVILSPVGVNISGAYVPRIYFRKGTGLWFSTPGTIVSGSATNGTWRFVIPSATLGGVTAGDVISYYVIGQTTSATPATFSNPAVGLVATDVLTVATPPTTPRTYTVNAVTLTGVTPSNSICYNPSAATSVSYAYTGSTGSPDQYKLTWSPAGPTDVTAFTALSSPINVNIPAATPFATYTGTITYRNSGTGCTSTTTVSLTINPPPAGITGSVGFCIGSSITLVSSTMGGTWISSNLPVATVGFTTGIVTGVSNGTATISYTLPTGCATTTVVTVTIPPAPITGVDSVCVGNTTTFFDAVPGGTWTSSFTVSAAVDPLTGVITGLNPDSSVIAYHLVGCAPVFKTVRVHNVPANITGSFYLCSGTTTTLHVITPGGTWSSSNPAAATIGSSSGIVTGVNTGTTAATTVISYTLSSTGCTSTNTVTVYPAPGPIPEGPFICLGQTIPLTNSLPGGTWSSDFSGHVSVGNTTGIATGVAAGTSATITYTMVGTSCFVTKVFTVTTPPGTPGPGFVLCTGYTGTLTNSVSGGVWHSQDTLVATVDSVSGVVSGISAGTATISYATSACNAVTYVVTVNQTPTHIFGITNLCDGGSTTMLYDTTAGGAWSISGGTATISPTGMVSGLTLGSTNVVTYTVPNACYTVAPIIVDTLPAPIAGIDSICVGSSTTFVDASTGGVWSSSNGTIATAIAATGVILGVSPGSVTISYTKISGCYVTKPFTVRTPLPTSASITYTPTTAPLCAGTPVTLTVSSVNTGATPTYQWQIFGVVQTGTDASFTYTPVHGDVVEVLVTGSAGLCAAPLVAHAYQALDVYPIIVPIVVLSSSTPIYSGVFIDSMRVNFMGESVTFFTEVTNAGTHPAYQWFVDRVAIPGATNSSFERLVYDNDTVRCEVNANPLCATGSITSTPLVVIYADYLAANQLSTANASLSLFPNPNTGIFTLKGNVVGNNRSVGVTVTNVLGQTVYSGNTEVTNGSINTKISLGNQLPPGSYMLHVNDDSEIQVIHFVVGE